MNARCEVIGWVLEDAQDPQVLVRDEHGCMSLNAVSAAHEFENYAIQTGVFRKGAPIIDPVTRETVGYEMERVSSSVAAALA